jgi:hypothetical protein
MKLLLVWVCICNYPKIAVYHRLDRWYVDIVMAPGDHDDDDDDAAAAAEFAAEFDVVDDDDNDRSWWNECYNN